LGLLEETKGSLARDSWDRTRGKRQVKEKAAAARRWEAWADYVALALLNKK